MMELRHGRTKLVLDPQAGSILRIEDALAGLMHIVAPACVRRRRRWSRASGL
jgi:hypothetical protein